ncbi:helix-turn-helix domain-containing protein [Polaromonas jejuensis]|nr:helix-turn-helix transcriptional regulator [Polaromonas jejuensis]
MSIPVGHLPIGTSYGKSVSMETTDPEHWRLRLAELIRHLGLKQKAFSEKTGIDPSYLSRLLYEPGKKGRKNLGFDTMLAVRQTYELSPGWFELPIGAELPNRNLPTETPDRERTWDPGPTATSHEANEHQQPPDEKWATLQEAAALLTKMTPEGRKNSIDYLRYMLIQHPANPPSTGGERDSIPHQKAA